MSSAPTKETAKLVWVELPDQPEYLGAFLTMRGRLFRLLYHKRTEILGIYPCDDEGAPVEVQLPAYGTNVRKLVLNEAVPNLLPSTIARFLGWVSETYTDLGILQAA